MALDSQVIYMTEASLIVYTVSQKNCAKLFLLELRQISTNFDYFWHNDGKEAKIMRGALIFHLT